jgi:hypothetical protein
MHRADARYQRASAFFYGREVEKDGSGAAFGGIVG